MREWLKTLSLEHKKAIGGSIRTVQIGWPLGMPLVRKMQPDLWEIRIYIPNGIARIFFTLDEKTMFLLHGFIKKSQLTPRKELELAKDRLKQLKGI